MPVANIISGSTELRFCSAAAAGLKYLLASQPENGIDGKEGEVVKIDQFILSRGKRRQLL